MLTTSLGKCSTTWATTRHNGTENGYTIAGSGGTPTGPIHGVSYFISGFSQGWGFRMDDGVFANGGASSSDLVTGHAGAADGRHEASFNVATALFPYAQGWQGAWVNGAVDGPATFSEGAPGIDASSVTWTGGQANVQLPGVNSATDGMLFVAPTSDSSTTRIASAFPNSSGGWTTTLRLDDDADTSGQTILTGGNGFQFFYLPYDATNLIGGMIDGTTGLPVQSAGDASFNLTRTSSGQYSLSVLESDGLTKKTEDDGMLILSVADVHPTNSTLGSRAFMSYEFDSGSGDFVIEARELISANSANPSDNFGNEFAMNDVDFYFAWVDFATPLAPPTAENADFNGDGTVDGQDFLAWQQGAILGDGSGSLAGGDANGDGNVDGSDFAIWESQFGGTGAAPSVGAVPEATAAALALLGSVAGLFTRRRR